MSHRKLSRLVRLIAVAISAAGLSAASTACGADDEQAAPGELPKNSAYLGVCRALAAAKAGDTAGATSVFENEAHGPLHDLSARVDDDDRALAARLLEKKQSVESAIRSNESTDVLRPALESLAAATADAITAVEGEPGPCPG